MNETAIIQGETFIAEKAERGAFVGTYVRQEVKDHLKAIAKAAPYGARTITCALNQILERDLAINGKKETNDNDTTK